MAQDDPEPQSPEVPGTAAQPPDAQGASSGTGFLVDALGHVLTNAHVVEGCTTLTIDGLPAQALAADAGADLALVHAPHLSGLPHVRFDAMPARLNSDVTVAGFPFSDILGGLNVTPGAVSSDRGIGGDLTRMQISAPVQPGNSGGPVFSQGGTVVGVVVARLRPQGEDGIPQNVNLPSGERWRGCS